MSTLFTYPIIPRKEPLKVELTHFLECIIQDKEPLVTGLDGYKALKIADKSLESSKLGKPVRISG